MKNKYLYTGFVVAGLVICVAPFACMTFAATKKTTENKRLVSFPNIVQDGKFNTNYLEDMGTYFEQHFAFREDFVSFDSSLRTSLFKESGVDNVVIGDDGWLFYTDTLNDYLGKETLSDKSLDNIVYNMDALQKKIEEDGSSFVFTVAPNKNSLYEQGMPYTYSVKYSETSNLDRLNDKLAQSDVNYVNLYQDFKDVDEVLYLKRDSHWNNKGAMLAYNAILDGGNIEHETYEDVTFQKKTDYIGDLNKMVYPSNAKPEDNYYYDIDTNYKYMVQGASLEVKDSDVSVEDAAIQTLNEEGKNNLLMYRDSFGNTLLPLMASQFENAYFYKTVPYNIGSHMDLTSADVVVVEKVERKIDELAYTPPVVSGAAFALPETYRTANTDTTLSAVIPEADANYMEVFGILDKNVILPDSKVYVSFTTAGGSTICNQCFLRTIPGVSEYGYVAYLPAEIIDGLDTDIKVYISYNEDIICIKDQVITLADLQIGNDTDDLLLPEEKEKTGTDKTYTIISGGEEKTITTDCQTIAEMIEAGEVTVGEDDRLVPELNTQLIDGEKISIQRVEVKEVKTTEAIPFESETKYSSSMDKGTSKITTEGVDGELTITYRETYVDGVKESSVKLSEEITKKPVNEITTVGTKVKQNPASNHSSGGSGSGGGKTVVSKVYVEDCGMDSGYWIITYSDGSVSYVDG